MAKFLDCRIVRSESQKFFEFYPHDMVQRLFTTAADAHF